MQCAVTLSSSCGLGNWCSWCPLFGWRNSPCVDLVVIVKVSVCDCCLPWPSSHVLLWDFCVLGDGLIIVGDRVFIRISFGGTPWIVFSNIVISWCEDRSCLLIVMILR